MLKTSLFKKLAGILLVLLILSSCDSLTEPLTPDTPSTTTENSFREGIQLNSNFSYLEFANEQAYFDMYQEIFDDQHNWAMFDETFEGFTSQRRAYDQLDSEEAQKEIVDNINNHPYTGFLAIYTDPVTREMEARRVVVSPIKAALVNKDGMIKIGEVVYRYAPGKVLSATNPTNDQVLEMINWDGTAILGFGTIMKDEIINPNQTARATTSHDVCSNTYWKGNKLFRVTGEQRETTGNAGSVFSREWIVSVKHQIRRFGVWWADKADLDMAFTGSFRIGAGGTLNNADFDPDEVTDESSFEWVVAECNSVNQSLLCDEDDELIWENGTEAEHEGSEHNNGTGCITNVP